MMFVFDVRQFMNDDVINQRKRKFDGIVIDDDFVSGLTGR